MTTPYVSIVVTSTTVDVDFGVVSTVSGIKRSKWRLDQFASVYQNVDTTVTVRAAAGLSDWPFSFNGSAGTMKVDSVNGVVPTSNDHLFELIAAVVS